MFNQLLAVQERNVGESREAKEVKTVIGWIFSQELLGLVEFYINSSTFLCLYFFSFKEK